MILNTGARTDTVQYFSKWLLNRFRAGFVYTRNPLFPNKVTRYELSPDKIDAVLFCSKNYAPILPRLHEITDKYRTYFHYTITAYGKDIEPGVPTIDESIHTLAELEKLVGRQRIAWRYDPVLLTKEYTAERHLETFAYMAEKLAPHIDRCIFSFVEMYKKLETNMPELIPLTDAEDSLYRAYDERRKIGPEDTLKAEPTKFKKNLVMLGQMGDALIRSYNLDMNKVGNISCSPLINPLLISYSHRNGISYRQEFKYNKLFHSGKLLRLVPQIGYNFTKKEFYAKLDGEYVYNPKKHGAIYLSVGNGNRIYSSVVLDQLQALPDSAFSFDGLQLDYFKDVYLNVSHNIEIVNGLTVWTGIAMHWRHAVHGTEEVAKRVQLKYNSFAPRLRIEWTPGMYYYMNGNRKVNIGSRFPTFVIDYEQGIKVLDYSNKYERLEVSAEQKIQIRDLNTLAYHIGGGFFTNQDEMYFVDYVNFANRNLPQGWNDDIGGTFQMLDSRWYNASRHYFRGNMTYETPFLLLYPVSRLLSFIQKERIYAGILFMPHLNPYFELGYGVGTHIFDFGIFIGNETGKFTSVGCKFTFELFNR